MFTTTLKTEQFERESWRLTEDLVYGDITVPKGFITNYASIKVFHNLFLFPVFALFSGYGNYSSTVHDYLYTTKVMSRKESDAIFYDALRDEGVARWRAWLFWAAVRSFGGSAWEKKL